MPDAKLTALTAVSVPDLLDLTYTVDVSDTTDDAAGSSRSLLLGRLLALLPGTPGGRLTLTTGVPVTSADVTGGGTVYYTPFIHDRIVLWDGTRWKSLQYSQVSLALSGLTGALPYDLFGYDSSGLTLEKLAWSGATTRATGISIQDGRYCKTGDKTRLYLGTFYSTSTASTDDSATKRFLWNMYNRRLRLMSKTDTTDNWAYTTATWRAANNSTANRLETVVGLIEDAVSANVYTMCTNSVGAEVAVGIALNSTSANDAQIRGGLAIPGVFSNPAGFYLGMPIVGYQYLQWVEKSAAVGTTTWYGDVGNTYTQSGILGQVWA